MTEKVAASGTVVVAATFTAEPLLPSLQFLPGAAGLPLKIDFAPYNQIFQELLTPTSSLALNVGGINVVLVRVEDFAREAENVEEARAIIGGILPEICNVLTLYGRRFGSTLFAALPPSPQSAPSLVVVIEAANAAWRRTRARYQESF